MRFVAPWQGRDLEHDTNSADLTVVSGAEAPPSEGEGLASGQRLGRYHILETVGRGGMGRVYRAYDPKLRREVALKVLHQARQTEAGAQSLLAEAQAMARLSHPNIVPVHDIEQVGTTVFVSMEFVEGKTLGQWLEHDASSTAEVLEVFVAAGRGLAAAHAVSLVHRDFKPANVLVGSSERGLEQRVLVTDFGLAHEHAGPPSGTDGIATQRDNDATIYTSSGGTVAGTPAYMSPEQHGGDALDARSDQYSFCVALYEALYDVRPFPQTELPDLCRAKLVGPPTQMPPCTRTGPLPRRVHRALLRGMSPKPADRFDAMESLLRELGTGTSSGSVRWVGLGALGVGAAILGVGAFAGERPCQGAKQRLHGAWDDDRRAQVREAVRQTDLAYAEDAGQRIEDALDTYERTWTDAWVEACEASHRGEQSDRLLDLRMACLSRHRRELGAFVQTLTELSADGLDDAVEAVFALESVLDCADTERLLQQTDPPPPGLADDVEDVRAQLARVRSLVRMGRPREAAELVRTAVQRAESIDFAPLTAEARFELGRQAIVAHHADEAFTLMQQAYFDALAHDERELALRAANELLFAYAELDADFERAELWQQHAEALLTAYGNPPDRRAALLNNMCVKEIRSADYEQAIEHCQQAIELREQLSGPDHPGLIGSLNNLAKLEIERGQPERASPHAERAYELSQNAYGPEHPSTADRLNVRGSILGMQGDSEAAAELFGRSLAILRAAEVDDARILPALTNLAISHAQMKNYDRAAELLEESVQRSKRFKSPDHVDLAIDYGNLASLNIDRGDLDAAERHANHALRIVQDKLGLQHPSTAEALYRMGQIRFLQERFDEARLLLERLLHEVHPDKVRPSTRALAAQYLARIHTRAGRLRAASDLLAQFDEAARADPSIGSVYVRAHFALAKAEREAGQTDAARARARAAQRNGTELLAEASKADEELETLVDDIESSLATW